MIARIRSGKQVVALLLRIGARPVAAVHDLFRADLRRSQRAYWARKARYTGVVAAYTVVAVAAGAMVHWVLTPVMLAPFLAEAAGLRWRARSSWGRRTGLPPGSVGVGTEPIMRFDGLARAAKRNGPVFKSNYFRDPMVCIADLGIATDFLRANADDLGHRPNSYNAHIPGGTIRWAAEPRHTELRRVFGRALSARALAGWEPVIDEVLCAVLSEVASSPAGALPREFLRDASRRVCTPFLFGVSAGDPEYAEACERMGRLDICRPYPVPHDEAERHLDWFERLIRSRIASPPPDRPPSVAEVLARDHPGLLDDPGVMRNLVYLGLGPRDDLAGLLTWVCWYLGENPRWLAAARNAADGDDLFDRIVSETLRLDQSEYIARVARRDLDLEDMRVPAGWLLRVCIREIHRDPAHFPDPARFDPDRFLGGGPDRSTYAPLGVDHHSCIGEPLARCVAGRFVAALARGFDLQVLDDGRRGMSENGHWAPNPRFRVRLDPVTAG